MKYVILLLVLTACTAYEPVGLQKVSPEQFNRIIQDDSVFVLDTHIPEQPHIEGTDALIPYNQLESNDKQLPSDKKTPIAVYCRSGSMSAEASQELIAMGYENVYDLRGGRNAYVAVFGE